MGKITGISVWNLETESGRHTGTDDHVYLGVYGTGGGREFALDVDDYNDWEPGSVDDYEFGSPTTGGREPITAADQLNRIDISLEDVTHVYLRKQGDRTTAGDDFWEVLECHVLMSSGSDASRLFSLPGTARLGNEYGHKVWLSDASDEGEDVHAQMLREAGIEPGTDRA